MWFNTCAVCKTALKSHIRLIQAPHHIPLMWDLIVSVCSIWYRIISHLISLWWFSFNRYTLAGWRGTSGLCVYWQLLLYLHGISICASASVFYSIKTVECVSMCCLLLARESLSGIEHRAVRRCKHIFRRVTITTQNPLIWNHFEP